MKFDVSHKEIDTDALEKIILSIDDKEDVRICMNRETLLDSYKGVGIRLNDYWEYRCAGHVVEIDETLDYGEVELR